MTEATHVIAIRDHLVAQASAILNRPPTTPLTFAEDREADQLLNNLDRFPHAFVIGAVADRQVSAKRAWMVPYRLYQRLGCFDFPSLAALPDQAIIDAMTKPTPLHWLTNEMPKSVLGAIRRIASVYDGDAAQIWSGGPPSAAIVRRFLEFDGVGPKIATMAANILVRGFRVPLSDRYSIDISVDRHIRRVGSRLGLFPQGATEEIITYRARELSPEYPGIFDLALWEIGQTVCRPNDPNCDACPLADLCPRVGVVTYQRFKLRR